MWAAAGPRRPIYRLTLSAGLTPAGLATRPPGRGRLALHGGGEDEPVEGRPRAGGGTVAEVVGELRAQDATGRARALPVGAGRRAIAR